MSASLVGSEMCIRDSLLPPGGEAPLGLALRGGLSAQLPTKHPVREKPVSYTHLTLPTICSV
eukprot:11740841-Alexandrium_andersonii.AAC.1